jgi:Uri superfamily endonuclease
MGKRTIKQRTVRTKFGLNAVSNSRKGTYLLILRLKVRRRITVGKLGAFDFAAGYYGYAGSAFGPGGLAGRIGHHLKPVATPRWHIDYLRKKAVIEKIWISTQAEKREHAWAGTLSGMGGVIAAVTGFGSSDCRCVTHLVYFQAKPVIREIQAALLRVFPDDEPIREWMNTR